MNEIKWFAVDVDVWAKANPDDADELLTMVGELGGEGAVVTSGDTGYGVRISVEAPDEFEAAYHGHGLMLAALEKTGIEHAGVARLEVMDDRYVELELDRPTERILGVAEVSEFLGVQKQRVPQLRTTRGFPAPIAELASGPVWKESSLRRFTETWQRRPGRPARTATG